MTDPQDMTHPATKPVPIVSFPDLMYMAFASATTPQDVQNRQEFLQRIQLGGYCFVELPDEVEYS